MVRTSAVFLGDSTLLIHCADAFRNAGHTVARVTTTNSEIREWAEARDIPLHSGRNGPGLGGNAEFDFLFCIGGHHWKSVDPDLIGSARTLAVRFHDSLLPPYTDLHGPSWALIEQKAVHGVTWHAMKSGKTPGGIVRQQSFDILEQDTAASLYAKCFEAGLDSFNALIADIGQGNLRQKPPDGAPGRVASLLPPALGTLDFSRSAREIAALVAGLDFGPLPNTFARAKIHLGNTVALVRMARALEGAASAAPGSVVRVQGESLQVSTGQGDILLTGCSNLAGQPLGLVLAAGSVLPQPDKTVLDRVAARIPEIAQGEIFWQRAYASAAPVELAYPRNPSKPLIGERKVVRTPLPSQPSPAVSVAAFFAWLASIAAQEQVSLMYSDRKLDQQAAPLESWLSGWVPMTLSIPRDASTRQASELAAEKIAQLREAGPCPRDLPVRLALAREMTQRLGRTGVAWGGQALADGMELMLAIGGDDRGAELVADEAVFSHAMLTLIATHFSTFLTAFEAGGSIAALPLVPGEEAAVATAMNRTAAPYDAACSVQALIAAQALRTPDHEAIRFEGLSLSYRELEDRAGALAARLRLRGVEPGCIVGLCIGRGLDLVVGLLAILKTGAAYLPLDPDYPHDRLAYMVEDSQTPLVVTTRALAAALALPAEKTCLFDAAAEVDALPPEPFDTPGLASRMAYLMYTSGSTGRPKGVMVTQQGLLNLFAGLDAAIPHEPPGRWLAVTSFSFDISVAELWWPLTLGFTVVIHSQAAHRGSVAQALMHHDITHLFCTPSMVSMVMAEAEGRQALSGLSVLMAGGEVFPLQLTKELCGLVRGKVFNVYGPTEISVLSNVCELSELDAFVPLGPPIANTTLHVRTPQGAECPAWVVGEVLIGGDGVSSGYWRRPELTAEKFIADPARPGGRLYKTGDLARRRPGGALEFVGRIDHQVKIRGHRIELGEIENAISRLSGVKEAVVLAREDKYGDRRLVAYVVPNAGHTLEPRQVQQAVARTLPAIMVPAAVVLLASFALTPNGKVDRRALPAPRPARTEDAEALPASALETRIAKAWEQVLGVDGITATANFFELGGSFFSAVQVQRQLLETLGHQVSLSDMTRFPSVRELAQALVSDAGGPGNLAALNERKPVSLIQPLPAGGADAGQAAATLELGPVESVVAGIWRDLLEIEQVGQHDDFFDLGGNSLAAVRMFAQLRKVFRIELPLAALFQASSLAGFSALVAKSAHVGHREAGTQPKAALSPNDLLTQRQRDWSPLVAICPGDTRRMQRPPIFCIHGAGGNVFNFKALSRKLGPEQPVYGLQPQGVDGHLPVLESLEAMAAQYVSAIRTVDPNGPYRLVGYSAGGVIALEMAQQLKKDGAQIALLAMIDTLTPAAAVGRPGALRKLWLMRRWSPKFAVERYRDYRQAQNEVQAMQAQIAEKLLRGEWLPPELVEPHLFRHVLLVLGRYRPELYQGPVVLFKANDATLQYLHAGDRLGWEGQIDGRIKVVNIPGSHNSIMAEPHLGELGAALKRELDGLDAATPKISHPFAAGALALPPLLTPVHKSHPPPGSA